MDQGRKGTIRVRGPSEVITRLKTSLISRREARKTSFGANRGGVFPEKRLVTALG